MVDQLARTTDAIRSRKGGSTTSSGPRTAIGVFEATTLSNVAPVLNRSRLAKSHVGPVGWDIDAGDIGYWRDGRSAAGGRVRLRRGDRVAHGAGIVLMHDSTADIDELRPRNRALELARVLIPELRARGYRFVRLDQVPQVASAALVSFTVTLTACDGRLVEPARSGSEIILVEPSNADLSAAWGVIERGNDRWALRSSGGTFFSTRRGERRPLEQCRDMFSRTTVRRQDRLGTDRRGLRHARSSEPAIGSSRLGPRRREHAEFRLERCSENRRSQD